MKKHLIYLLFILLAIPLFSSSFDDSVANILDNGSFMEKDDETVFMSSTYATKDYLSEDDAYSYLTDVAYDFFLIQADWLDLTDETASDEISKVVYVAVPYADGENVYIIYISMEDLLSEYNYDDYYYDYDDEELYYEFAAYIGANAGTTNLSEY
ncbi:MAG TPA: hypothetical protein PL124_07935 [Candidatus Cloacimonadota bacterium]|nr:hypothetical protein [Candidatus Cloacimonadota bacterium]HPS39323.1 hypothetical protein [Candidatus Cloacimonadota bacterium]